MHVVGLMEECITWVDSVTLQVCAFIYVQRWSSWTSV
jgi:hypothetical protein